MNSYRTDAPDIIKSRVKMRDVLLMYGIQTPRSGRMKCPLHNGDDNNFQVYETGDCCHTRCGSGDVFNFVMEMERCDFKAALHRIDREFSLGLYADNQDVDLVALRKAQQLCELEQQRKEMLRRMTAYSNKQFQILCEYIRWLKKQEQTPLILQDLAYMDRLTEKFYRGDRLIDFDARALVDTLKSKHERRKRMGSFSYWEHDKTEESGVKAKCKEIGDENGILWLKVTTLRCPECGKTVRDYPQNLASFHFCPSCGKPLMYKGVE